MSERDWRRPVTTRSTTYQEPARTPGKSTLAGALRAPAARTSSPGQPDAFQQLAARSADPVPYAETLQPRFGDALDLSSVRAHVGAGAALRAHGAQAAAWDGEHVAFADPRPALDTVAEEMVHIYQQRNNGGPAGGPRISDPSDRAEQEARAASERIAAGEPMPAITAPAVSDKRTEPARLTSAPDELIATLGADARAPVAELDATATTTATDGSAATNARATAVDGSAVSPASSTTSAANDAGQASASVVDQGGPMGAAAAPSAGGAPVGGDMRAPSTAGGAPVATMANVAPDGKQPAATAIAAPGGSERIAEVAAAPERDLAGLATDVSGDGLQTAAVQGQAALDRIFDGQRERLAAPKITRIDAGALATASALTAGTAPASAPPSSATPVRPAAPDPVAMSQSGGTPGAAQTNLQGGGVGVRASEVRHDAATEPQRNEGEEREKAAQKKVSAGPRPRVEMTGSISLGRPDGRAMETERGTAAAEAAYSQRAMAGSAQPAAQIAPPPPVVAAPAIAVPPLAPPAAVPLQGGARPATLNQAALSAELETQIRAVATAAEAHDREFSGRLQALDSEREAEVNQRMAAAQAEQAAVVTASNARVSATRQQWQAENQRVRDQRIGQVQTAHTTAVTTAGSTVERGEQAIAADLSSTESQADAVRGQAEARAASILGDAQGRAGAARSQGTVMRRHEPGDGSGSSDAPNNTSEAEAEAILDAAEAEMQAVLAEAERLVGEMLEAANSRSFDEVTAIRAEIDALFASLDTELAAALALVETELPDVAARFETTLDGVIAEAQASVGAIYSAAITACATGYLGSANALAAGFSDDIAVHHRTVSTEFRNALQQHSLIYGDEDRVLGSGGFDYYGAELVDPSLASTTDGNLDEAIYDQVYADNLPANFDELSPAAQAWALQAAEDAATLASERYRALAAEEQANLSPTERQELRLLTEEERQQILQQRALHRLNVGHTGGVGEVDLSTMTDVELYNYNHELVNRSGGDFRTGENEINIIGMRGVENGRVHDNSTNYSNNASRGENVHDRVDGEVYYDDTVFVVRLVAGPDGRLIPDVHQGSITTDYGDPTALENAGYGRNDGGERRFGLLTEGTHSLYINEYGTVDADGNPIMPSANYTPGQHPLKGDFHGAVMPSVLDADGDRLADPGETAAIGMGTNLHGGGPADQPVDTWSANCQVIPTAPEGDTSTDVMYYDDFMALLMEDPNWVALADSPNNALNYSQDHAIPYTLVEGRNLP